jgi:hypothetical protein
LTAFAFLLGAVVVSAAVAAADTAIQLQTNVAQDSVTVGERLHIRYTLVYPDSLTLLPPGEIDTGDSRIMSLKWSDTTGEGDRTKSADLVVMPLDLEMARVPQLPFRLLTPGGDTLTVMSEDVEVPVRHLTAEQSEPRPLKPQWEAPADFMKYILMGAGLVLLAIAAIIWWRRRSRREVVVPPAPVLPADFVALRDLQEIERMGLLEGGRYKKYYTLVIDVLRHYFERRYGILAMDRTSDEMLFELNARRAHLDELEPLLREADLVKFAKHRPEPEAGQRALESARDIVVRTAPKPVPAAPMEEVG